MSFKITFAAAVAATLLTASTAFAGSIMAKDAYARSARPNAPTGAAFMMLVNHSEHDDRLISVRSDAAKRVELHTHIDKGEGVMQMREIEDGIAIPAGGSHMMKRGGDHVMLMGLNQSFVQGESITVTFEFEKAGEITVEIPIDNERKPAHGEGHADDSSHSGHTSD